MLRALLLFFFLGWSAQASEPRLVPQLHDVVDVAPDDVLNIRAAPTARAEIIGGLAPDATGVEVVALNDDASWGRVNHAEASGWVYLRYMRPRGVHIDNFNMPTGLRCFGTEPFWDLTHEAGQLDYRSLGGEKQSFAIDIAQDTGITDDFTRMIRAGDLTAYIHPASCNDGMSNRAYGLAIGLMTGPRASLLTGCCTLAR